MEVAHAALLVLVVAVVVVIIVVGAGTTWVYLAEVRRPEVHDRRRPGADENRDVPPVPSRGARADQDRAA